MNRPVLLQFDSPPPCLSFRPYTKSKIPARAHRHRKRVYQAGPTSPSGAQGLVFWSRASSPPFSVPVQSGRVQPPRGPALGRRCCPHRSFPPPPKPANGCPSACSPAVLLLFEFSKASPNSPPAGATRSCASWAPLGESPPQLAGWPEAWEYLGLEI